MQPDWDVARQPWHAHYPADVSPGLIYEPLRAEALLQKAAERFPDLTAIRYFRTNWTYRELISRVKTVAGNLRRMGVETGDRVMLVLPNCPEYVVIWFALHWLGAQVVHANPLLAAKDLTRLMHASNARVVVGFDMRLAPVLASLEDCPDRLLLVSSLASHFPIHIRTAYKLKIRMSGQRAKQANFDVHLFEELFTPGHEIEQPVLTDPSLPAVLQPTGGTTGVPKIAVLTHAGLHANVAQLHIWSGCKPGCETVLAVLPFFHVFGSTVVLLSAIAGCSTLLLQATFDAKKIAKLLERYRPGIAPMVPFMFASLCEEFARRPRDVSGMRLCFSGAAPLQVELKEEFEQLTGALICEGYGLSEASPCTHSNPPDAPRAGSIGLPLPGTEAKIVNPNDQDEIVPPTVVGELAIKGPQLMAGYLDNQDETSQVLRDGWLYTGDLARMDPDGYFTIVDRKKDMIISGGLNVYPAEVESVLRLHPSVSECAVVGTPDRKYGERVTAFVVPVAGAKVTGEALRAFCKTQLAGYKIPKAIELRTELPKSFLGKIRRVDLRADAA